MEEEESPGAMSAAKPTLIIIPGGWHVPESYEKLVGALETAGYEVHCPRLPSTNQVWRALLELDAEFPRSSRPSRAD
jgi:hypothetical protein